MTNFNTPPEDRKQNNNESAFTPELRRKLSEEFIRLMHEAGDSNRDLEKIALETAGISKEEREAEKGLNIFRSALHELVKSPDFPDGKEKDVLRVYLENLNTFNIRSAIRKLKQKSISEYDFSKLEDPAGNPFSGIESYSAAVDTILSILKNVLTPEINVVIETYKEKLFSKPFQQAIDELESEI